MKYELKKLSFGTLLGEAFNLYFDNFFTFFVISSLSFIPAVLFVVLSGPGSQSRALAGLIFLVFYITANTISTALIIEIVSNKYLKKHEGINQYIRNVIPFILPIIGLSILQVIVIAGPGVLLMLIHPGLLVLYIFPAIYFFLGFILSPQSLIVERIGIIDAMKRSFFLTKGKKLEIFGYVILAGIFSYIIRNIMLHVIAPIVIRLIDPVSVRLFVYLSIYYLSQAFLTGITSCIYILVYFNQRIVKEGFDLEHLVDQFDSSGPLQGAAE